MNLLSTVAGFLGIEVQAVTEKVKRAIIVNSIVGLFGVIALTFLLIAGYLALGSVVGPVFAALYIGAAAFVIAVAVYLIAQIGNGAKHQRALERRRSSETSALLTTAAISALPLLLKSPLLRNVGLPLAAIAAFFVFGNSAHGKDDDL